MALASGRNQVAGVSVHTAARFSVSWATRAKSGYVHDVEYRYQRAGATSWGAWKSWKTGVKAAYGYFTPSRGSGSYEFQSRLRNATTGNTSEWSPGGAITVSTPTAPASAAPPRR